MSKQQSTKKLTLAAAAEALVEAASLEADAMPQKQLAQNLDSLKESFDSSLNRVVQTLKSSNENFDAKINTLNQHVTGVKNEITGVKNEISALKSLLEEETKQKTLERALALADLESFNYYERNYGEKYSSDLAKKVIRWFMLGYGFTLPKGTLPPDSNALFTNTNTTNETFHEKFKEQIKKLIKREPRMVNNKGTFTIYYS